MLKLKLLGYVHSRHFSVSILLIVRFGFLPRSLSCLCSVPDPPLIDLSNSRVYNEASIWWRLSEDHLPTDHHVLEYRRWVQTYKEIPARRSKYKLYDCNRLFSRLGGPSRSPSQEDGEDSGVWQATDKVYGPSAVVFDLDPDSLYSFRVRSCRNSMFSPYSPEVTFHTPPAPGKSERCDSQVYLFIFGLHIFPPCGNAVAEFLEEGGNQCSHKPDDCSNVFYFNQYKQCYCCWCQVH